MGPGMLHDRLGHGPGLVGIGPRPSPAVDRVREVAEGEPPYPLAGPRAREGDEAPLVELAVGHRDERFVAASVMPLEHALGTILGEEETQDALEVRGDRGVPVLIAVPRGEEGIEEPRGRELAAVAHHHGLGRAENGAEGVHGTNLAGLVEDHEIEGQLARGQVGGDGQRAHHEDRFHRLQGPSRLAHEAADGQEAPLLVELPLDDRELAPLVEMREFFPMFERQAGSVVLEEQAVQLAELLDAVLLAGAVELGEVFPLPESGVQEAPVPGPLEGPEQAFARALPVVGQIHHRREPCVAVFPVEVVIPREDRQSRQSL